MSPAKLMKIPLQRCLNFIGRAGKEHTCWNTYSGVRSLGVRSKCPASSNIRRAFGILLCAELSQLCTLAEEEEEGTPYASGIKSCSVSQYQIWSIYTPSAVEHPTTKRPLLVYKIGRCVVRRQHPTNTWGWLGRRFPPRFSTCLLGRHSPPRACVQQWWSLHACSPHARTNKSQHRRHNANDGHWCRDEFV